jgi:hypothetical protein
MNQRHRQMNVTTGKTSRSTDQMSSPLRQMNQRKRRVNQPKEPKVVTRRQEFERRQQSETTQSRLPLAVNLFSRATEVTVETGSEDDNADTSVRSPAVVRRPLDEGVTTPWPKG